MDWNTIVTVIALLVLCGLVIYLCLFAPNARRLRIVIDVDDMDAFIKVIYLLDRDKVLGVDYTENEQAVIINARIRKRYSNEIKNALKCIKNVDYVEVH